VTEGLFHRHELCFIILDREMKAIIVHGNRRIRRKIV